MAWADRPPLEQVALDYCAPRGIALSVFFGRVVGLGQPQWLEGDWEAALDWQAKENLKCPGCGNPQTECMADEDDAPVYEVEVRRCHACKVKGIEEREIAKLGDPGPGLYSVVRKAS